MSLLELEAEVMKLPLTEKAQLFHKLALDLEAEELDPITDEELEQRADDLISGHVQGISAEAMFAESRKKYGLD